MYNSNRWGGQHLQLTYKFITSIVMSISIIVSMFNGVQVIYASEYPDGVWIDLNTTPWVYEDDMFTRASDMSSNNIMVKFDGDTLYIKPSTGDVNYSSYIDQPFGNDGNSYYLCGIMLLI